ncbi:phage late control D family protein [Xanthobacter versatilis]|uniref:phage late control D family protein n=1 Tax=Xanthobacter autotrophicus (strain ATCC BAA-1158 / Py2) TaxID=78245 RepID=UPI0037283382
MTYRQPNAQVILGGTPIEKIEASVTQSKTKKSDTFKARTAISVLPAGKGLSYWATAADVSAQVLISTGSGYTKLFDGKVDAVDIDLETGMIEFSGRDKAADLIDKTSAEKFQNKTPDKIVKEIASRHGISVDAKALSEKAGKIYQIDWNKITNRSSEWTVINHIADLHGMVAYITGGKLYFKPADETLPVFSVHYRAPTAGIPADGNFLRLKIRRNLILTKPVKVSVKSWNHKQKKVISSDKQMSGTGTPLIYNFNAPGLTQDQADKIAQKRLDENTSHENTLEIEAPGDPSVNARMSVQLTGTNSAFDQSYEIQTVEHSISADGGYTMTISTKAKSKGRK